MKRSELLRVLDNKSKDLSNFYMRNHVIIDNREHNWSVDELINNYRRVKRGIGKINDYAYIIYCDGRFDNNLFVINDYDENDEEISDYIYKWVLELERLNS